MLMTLPSSPLAQPPPPFVLPSGGKGDRHLVNTKTLLQVSVVSEGSPFCEALPLVSPVLRQHTLVTMFRSSKSNEAGRRNFTPSHSRSKFHCIGSPLNRCIPFISLAHLLPFVIMF